MAQALSTALRSRCQSLIRDAGAWVPGEPRPPQPIGLLGGGLSNLSVLLGGEHGRYVLRIPQGPPGPFVNRHRELHLQRRAAAAGLAPAVLFGDADTGVMITPFVAMDAPEAPPEADSKRPTGALNSGSLNDVAALLRAIHSLTLADDDPEDGVNITDRDAPPLCSALCLETWEAHAGPQTPLEALSKRESEALTQSLSRIREEAGDTGICHNDLLRANRIMTRTGLMAIDWEYAGCGDPFFDLANVASELARADALALLRAYLGRRESISEAHRFHDQCRIQAAIAVCWHAASGPLSAQRLAMTRLRHLLAAVAGPGTVDE
jgi:aminoglycoside phosphotransferase (APT) family kinase protein